ncbi:GNAT family N-acetyltransferase [Embleya scabrispora]|uniref:GNAT family N-acetyltransferase n=2 Tax=Embleya scabrispora TaxID=159449 RepID=A0A1T3P7S0_9ACTN|nr:GNAT family N-acetyltransferase [Embleya scabrispora]
MAVMAQPRQIIECGDFVLRRWRARDDFAAAFTLIDESVDHLRPWEHWVTRHSEEYTRKLLERFETGWANGDVYNYAIVRDGTPVGMCQTYRAPEPQGRRLGYWLHPAATGKGIATRATAALVEETFRLPESEYVEITHDVANTASEAIPRRLGFTEIRREPGTPPVAPSGTGIDVVWRLDRPGEFAEDAVGG